MEPFVNRGSPTLGAGVVTAANGDLVWRKSSASGNNGCVELARSPKGEILVRDSKNPSAGHLAYTPHEWRSFLAGLESGEFDFLLP